MEGRGDAKTTEGDLEELDPLPLPLPFSPYPRRVCASGRQLSTQARQR